MVSFAYVRLLDWLLAAAFIGGGIHNLLGSPAVQTEYRRWGYPARFHLVSGGLQVIAGAMIAIPLTRWDGLAAAAAVCVAAALTLIEAREFAHLPPSFVLLALLAIAALLG